jgi:hypothetical protein
METSRSSVINLCNPPKSEHKEPPSPPYHSDLTTTPHQPPDPALTPHPPEKPLLQRSNHHHLDLNMQYTPKHQISPTPFLLILETQNTTAIIYHEPNA